MYGYDAIPYFETPLGVHVRTPLGFLWSGMGDDRRLPHLRHSVFIGFRQRLRGGEPQFHELGNGWPKPGFACAGGADGQQY